METFLWTIFWVDLLAVTSAAVIGWFVKREDTDAWKMPALVIMRWTIFLLSALALLLLVSPLLYWFSYSPSISTGQDIKAGFDCAAFAYPCLAGILAGMGLIAQKGKDFRRDQNSVLYLASTFFLGLAYAFYVARHPRPFVIFTSGLYVCAVCLLALVPVIFQHFVSPDQTKSTDEAAATKPFPTDHPGASDGNDDIRLIPKESENRGKESDGTKHTKPEPGRGERLLVDGVIPARWGTLAGIAEMIMVVLLLAIVAEVVVLVFYTASAADPSVMRHQAEEQ